jgi:hypothetical protein
MDCQQNIESPKIFPRWKSRAFGRFAGQSKEVKMLDFTREMNQKTSFYHLK